MRAIYTLPKGTWVLLLLLVGVIGSGLGVAYTSHWNRVLLNELFAEVRIQNRAQAEWGRLILEHGTWTAHSRIEQLATQNLHMHIPEPANIKLVTP